MRSLGLFIGLLAIVFGAGWFLWNRPTAPQSVALQDRVRAARMLGEYLEEYFSDEQALVISNPYTQESGRSREIYDFEAMGIRGLEDSLGVNVAMGPVVFPELRPEARSNPGSVWIDPSTTTPLSFLVAEGAYDVLATKHPDCRILISLIGLPLQVTELQIWKPEAPHRFALLLPDLRMVGDASEVVQAFQTGKIAVAVVRNPRDLSEGDGGGFQRVTAENVEDVLKRFPEALGFRSRSQ